MQQKYLTDSNDATRNDFFVPNLETIPNLYDTIHNLHQLLLQLKRIPEKFQMCPVFVSVFLIRTLDCCEQRETEKFTKAVGQHTP